MNERSRALDSTLSAYPPYDSAELERRLADRLTKMNCKIVVLDDDPTGVQTVHGVYVYTDWSERSIRDGFSAKEPIFYILTNSRGFSAARTKTVHEDIAKTIAKVGKSLNQPFVIISRSDSTLRGHYPLETEALREGLAQSNVRIDGEILFPFFLEGGRYTIDDVHYVAMNGELVPAGETEFAKDKSFGYRHSNLREWVEERTHGEHQATDVASVSLQALRSGDLDGIAAQIRGLHDFKKLIVNATGYADVKVFATALATVLREGKGLLFRSAAALPKVLGGVPDKPLLGHAELVDGGNTNGGFIVIGSHVKKTSDQLAKLRDMPNVEFVEFDQHTALDDAAFEKEQARALTVVKGHIKQGRTCALYTRRDRLDVGGGAEAELALAVKISDALSGIVNKLSVKPKFLIAKGGITSSDVGTKGLEVKRALVLGQILPGVPVWQTGADSKFPGMSYVIFPGNVGSEDALREAVEKMMDKGE